MNEFGNLIAFLEQLADPVGVASSDGRLVRINAATAQLVNITQDDDTNFAEYIDTLDRERLSRLCVLCTHPSAREVGPLAIRVSVTYRAVQHELWVSATPLIGEDPQCERILLLFRRVTPQLEAAGSLQPRVHFDQPPSPSIEEDLRIETPEDASLLTERERAVLQHTLDGSRVQTIAAQLFMSEHTVRNTLKRINRKLGVHSTAELRETFCRTNASTNYALPKTGTDAAPMTPVGSIASFRVTRLANQRPTSGTPASSDSELCSRSGTNAMQS
jgi:DNA-binding CsgD family transcriptional regulator